MIFRVPYVSCRYATNLDLSQPLLTRSTIPVNPNALSAFSSLNPSTNIGQSGLPSPERFLLILAAIALAAARNRISLSGGPTLRARSSTESPSPSFSGISTPIVSPTYLDYVVIQYPSSSVLRVGSLEVVHWPSSSVLEIVKSARLMRGFRAHCIRGFGWIALLLCSMLFGMTTCSGR